VIPSTAGVAWSLLVLAGLLEVGWAVGLRYTDGFTRPLPSVLTVLAIAASMVLLSLAVRTLPIGTAYAVWVGIGAAGAALLGILLFGEPGTPGRLFFLGLLVLAIVGLQVTTPVDDPVVPVPGEGPGTRNPDLGR
jgi:quaternary ammonium compound-resistance protein SugE